MAETVRADGKSRIEDEDSSGRIWQGLKALIFGSDAEPSLREQLEEAINEHDNSENGAVPKEGDLSTEERRMLRNMLHFSEKDADRISVPRSDIIAISKTADFSEVVAIFAEHGHSRIPVFQDLLDHIIGMVHIKDVFAIIGTDCASPEDWAQLICQPIYVPENMSALEILAAMREKRTHLAIVFNEYSGTEGLVTIEDIVEEIIGDIEDEHDDAPEILITQLENGLWEVDARAELDDVAEQIDPLLADVEEDIDTMGGLAFVLAGEVPEQGRVLAHSSGWRLEVIEAEDKKVKRLRLHAPEERQSGDIAG